MKAITTKYVGPTTGYLKRAWIRNNAPEGIKAKGHISCPCGQAPESDYTPEQGNITCACGIVYTWDGWIVDQPNKTEAAA